MPASRKRPGRGSGIPKSKQDFPELAAAVETPKPRAIKNLPPDITQQLDNAYAAAAKHNAGANHAHSIPNTPTPAPASTPRPARSTRPASRGMSTRNKVLIGGAVIGTAGIGAKLAYDHNKRKGAMSKNLINPFEEVVVFGKAYPAVYPFSAAKSIGALHPTGSHVGHGNKLVHITGKATSPQGTGLRRYTTKPTGLRVGPFGKADSYSVPRNLRRGPNSNIPDGSRRGQRI